MRLAGGLLERAARATPAAVEDHGTGWWLRHTDTGAWWSGAALAHGPADGLAGRIDAAERFYAGHCATARFQVCAGCPDRLDPALAERGYRRETPISLLTAVRGVPHLSPDLTVRVAAAPDLAWLAVLGATSGPGTDLAHETRLLRRIDEPQAYVTVLADGVPAGIGRAVADSGWTGVFTMATAPEMRRRGVARLVLSAIGQWAGAHGAPRMYLQVEQSNDAARRLYEAAGFGQLSAYHYRVRA